MMRRRGKAAVMARPRRELKDLRS